MGSPAYMSPGQVLEKPLDRQTNIYSLVVVIYRLLTGRLPFFASNKASLVYQITNIEPAPPSIHRADLPEALEILLMRTMAKDLGVRFKSWSDFSRELAQSYRHLELPADAVSDQQKFDTISKMPFFQDLSEVETWEIVRISAWHQYPSGKDLIREGETGEDFFLILNGKAQVKKSDRVVGALETGDCFGELLYFEKQRTTRATTITSASEMTVVKIKAQALQQATDGLQKQFNKSFLRILVNRLSHVGDRRALQV